MKRILNNLKQKEHENFPVASFFLPKAIRSEVHDFYNFVRLADDIADNPDLSTKERLDELTKIESDIPTNPVAKKYVKKLLNLFKKETRHAHPKNILIQNWEDLLQYCEGSANPVGRFLIDLQGESQTCYPASDALCTLLQILNHIQDVKKDWQTNKRAYIPKEWWPTACLPLYDKNLILKMLHQSAPLLKEASMLPKQIKGRGFRIEVYFILNIASALHKKLHKNIAWPYNIKLSRFEKCVCLIGALKGIK